MSSRHTTFHEVMEGTFHDTGGATRAIRLDLGAELPGLLRPRSDLEGPLTGRVRIAGLADDTGAAGTLRVAPLVARRIHYRLAFTGADGSPLRLDGWKSIDPLHPVRSMTSLPATITDAAGAVVGEARLRFNLRRDLPSFLLGFRFPAGSPAGPRVAGPR